MADLKIIITPRNNSQEHTWRSSSDRGSASEHKHRLLMKAYNDKIDDLAIETYDMENKHPGDGYDSETKVKIFGFTNLEKINKLRNVMENTFKRRLLRHQERKEDANFYSQQLEQPSA